MGYKLLVVDDDKDIVDFFKDRLLREGYEVITAFDGEEALMRIEENDPDIVLLDLIMPKLNGFDVLKKIREVHKDRWRPVIVISAIGELEAIRESYSLEADHYLTKPCDIDNVLRGVRTMISLMPARIKEY